MLELSIPGDKSISHRAIILASIADGITNIKNFLLSQDCLATVNAMRAMGVDIEIENSQVNVHGVGLHGLQAPKTAIDCGNSGTTMRLLAGLLAAQSFESELIGDNSLMQRPMRRIADPLQLMGAQISTSIAGTAPLFIKPVKQLKIIDYHLPVASAQVKSCLLLAGLYVNGGVIVHEPIETRDHTELMLRAFRYSDRLIATTIDVPGDISSAAFFIVAALLTKHRGVLFNNIGVNVTRTGVLDILKQMGAEIEIVNQQYFGYEPVADLLVRTSQLCGVKINESVIPKTIDELPIICIAAACAKGATIIRGAKELRVKESDRIHAIAEGLQAAGIAVEEYPDGLNITGGQLIPATINNYADHRIAMAFMILNLLTSAEINVNNSDVIQTSFPDFIKKLVSFDNYINNT